MYLNRGLRDSDQLPSPLSFVVLLGCLSQWPRMLGAQLPAGPLCTEVWPVVHPACPPLQEPPGFLRWRSLRDLRTELVLSLQRGHKRAEPHFPSSRGMVSGPPDPTILPACPPPRRFDFQKRRPSSDTSMVVISKHTALQRGWKFWGNRSNKFHIKI